MPVMKMIFIFALIVFNFVAYNARAFASNEQDKYIMFEHVGSNDKIIGTLVLAEKKPCFPVVSNVPDYLYYKYVLNNTLYSKSEIIVINTKRIKDATAKAISDFGCFKISIINGSKKNIFFVQRKDAINLFSRLYELYSKEKINPNLIININGLKDRITL